MERRRVAIRILGVATTTHGFAFAAIENHDHLVDLDHRRTPAHEDALRNALDAVLQRTRPLFVACDATSAPASHSRKRLLVQILTDACASHGIMVLRLKHVEIAKLAGAERSAKWDIAAALTKDFPELQRKLPARRVWWRGTDYRIGIFMALAASAAAWRRFRPSE